MLQSWPALAGCLASSSAAFAPAVLACSRGFSALAEVAQANSAGRAAIVGQPSHHSHPHLLGPDELAPGVHAKEFQARRRNLARLLAPGSVAIVPAASLAYVTGVIPHPYRQEADFLYLTGIQQQSVAVIETAGNGDYQFQLYLPPPDQDKERWDGAWLGQAAAEQVFRADEVYSMMELPSRVQQLAARATSVLFDFDKHTSCQYQTLRQALHDAVGRGKTSPLKPHIHRLRWIKSPAELALMRTSAAIAATTMQQCMAVSQAGVPEGLLASRFEFGVKLAGAQRLAYPPVVAGGPDACTIHYSRNDKQVAGGEMVLMDAGCEYHGYASDVSRTWPVNGRYSRHQRALYEVVLTVRQRCLEAAVPGNTLAKLHQLSVQLLSEGLHQLGVLPRASLEDFTRGLYKDFYCHSIGHYLGLDVHDTNTIGPHRTLEPGVVLAVEPGLYIPDHPQFGPWAGLGVRIEDDVLVAHSGAQVLSDAVPVDPDEIEALVGAAAAPAAAPAGAAAGPQVQQAAAAAAAAGGCETLSAGSDSEPAPTAAVA